MSDKTNEPVSKPVNIIFSVIDIDGKPLEGARIRIDRRGDETTSESFSDIFTDKDGKAIAGAGKLLVVDYTLTHGYYSVEGSGGIGDTDRHFSISFAGFKLLSASFDCPGIPEDVPMGLTLCERVSYKSGFDFHPLMLTSNLKRNQEAGMWETHMYVPTGDFSWTLKNECVYSVTGEVSIQEDISLNYSLLPYYPVMFTAENLTDEEACVMVDHKGLCVEEYKLDTDIYMPQGEYSCRLSDKTNFVEFQINNSNERQSVHLDYAVLSKTEPVSLVIDDLDKREDSSTLLFAPSGYFWTLCNFIMPESLRDLELPVGNYNYKLEQEGVMEACGTLEVREGVTNELVIDLSNRQKVTYQSEVEEDPFVILIDKNLTARAFSDEVSDSFYVEPGTYVFYSPKARQVEVVVGDTEPEKVILPLEDKGESVMCVVKDVCGNPVLDAIIEADGGPFILASSLYGFYMANHVTLGKQTFVVSAPGYKTYTCTVDVRKEIDVSISLLLE